MLSVLIAISVMVSSIWVYIDATANRIGRRPGVGGIFNMSAGAWATVTLLFWIVGFPSYLANRGRLKEDAKLFPVLVSGRIWKTLLLAAVGGVIVLWTLLVVLSNFYLANEQKLQTEADRRSEQVPVARQTGQWQPGQMTSSEVQRCTDTLEIHIRVAKQQARYVGEQRAVDDAVQKIRESAGDKCAEYIIANMN